MQNFLALLVGIWGLLNYLSGLPSLNEVKRILQGETAYLSARMQDIQTTTSSAWVQLGKKRKRDDELSNWMMEGKKLVEEAQHLINLIGSWRHFLLGAKVRWGVCKLINSMKDHDTNGGLLLTQALYDVRGPCRGHHIPVKQLVGQFAFRTMDQLKLLLEGDKFGIALHGARGIGKSFYMKHLHNWALTRFKYVFWVPSPAEFTIRSVQNAVASLVHCDFASNDSLSVRAGKLFDTLENLGSFAIFLDDVPKGNFSLEQVGIPVLAEGSKNKLVLSTLECGMLDSFEKFEVTRLSREDAYELFKHKANIGEGFGPLDGISSLLADTCGGLPRIIENTATNMCGLEDLSEWKNALVESGNR